MVKGRWRHTVRIKIFDKFQEKGGHTILVKLKHIINGDNQNFFMFNKKVIKLLNLFAILLGFLAKIQSMTLH